MDTNTPTVPECESCQGRGHLDGIAGYCPDCRGSGLAPTAQPRRESSYTAGLFVGLLMAASLALMVWSAYSWGHSSGFADGIDWTNCVDDAYAAQASPVNTDHCED